MDKSASFGALRAIDALNRRLPTANEVGPLKEDKFVGVFYFLTHGVGERPIDGPNDVTRILQQSPDAIWDFDHPAWGKGGPLYWGEPLFGYYFIEDRWVLRRHVKLLTYAMVDFIVFDTTNRVTFLQQVLPILETLEEYRRDGFRVPQIVYYTNTQSGDTVAEIYNDIYKKGLFPELWFHWEGKPLIIGLPDECGEEERAFFTFRLAQWPTEKKKPLGFPWIEFERPQRAWHGPDGKAEIVPVSVAQHPNISFGDAAFYGEPSTRGRAWHGAGNDKTPEALAYGYNVAEQWERAIELDPRIVFFTGWNEWTAGKIKGDPPRPVLMIDQADAEYSRDVEPMRAGSLDNYYMQLCDYIRRFKGAPPLPGPFPPHCAGRKGLVTWAEAPARYAVMPFGTIPRECEGVGGIMYSDHTGRNEFVELAVAHDDEYIRFYARTREPIVFNMFTKWMMLYIGVEGRPFAPHWHGYHFVLSDIVLDRQTTFLQRCLGGYRWGGNERTAMQIGEYEVDYHIRRATLGISDGPFEIYFKWADHTGRNQTIEDFYLHGDSAPYGRFSYIYRGE